MSNDIIKKEELVVFASDSYGNLLNIGVITDASASSGVDFSLPEDKAKPAKKATYPTWRDELLSMLDDDEEIISCTFDDEKLDSKFNSVLNPFNNYEFFAWSQCSEFNSGFVYYYAEIEQDGWIDRVSRHPQTNGITRKGE